VALASKGFFGINAHLPEGVVGLSEN